MTKRQVIATSAAWVVAAALVMVLIAQRYAAAVSGELGIDLGIWLDASGLAREGLNPYDAPGYTYTPLMAWILMPLAGQSSAMGVWTAVSLIAGVLAIGFVVAAHRRLLPGWRAPAVSAIAAVTLLYSHVLVTELFWGQAQLLLLALLALAALVVSRWPSVAGIAIALAAVLKTWPALIGLWLVRAGARRRVRSLIAAIATVAALALAMVLLLGPDSIRTLITRTFGYGEQPWPVYSVWYFARHWPPMREAPQPFSDSPFLGQVVTVTLLLGVLALMILAVLRPGTASLSLWNIAAATTLLIPVSHAFYRLLVLPLLWVWLAHLLGQRQRAGSALMVGALAAWWIIGFRVPDSTIGTGWWQFAVVVATIVVVCLSTVMASLIPTTDIGAERHPESAELPSRIRPR